MTGVQLHSNINFLPLNDEVGAFGVLFMHNGTGQVVLQETIEDQDQFREVYTDWMDRVSTIFPNS